VVGAGVDVGAAVGVEAGAGVVFAVGFVVCGTETGDVYGLEGVDAVTFDEAGAEAAG